MRLSYSLIVATLCFFVLAPALAEAPAPAGRARVCVMRLSAPSGPAAAAADAASDTLILCLRSLGNYEVSEAEPGPATRLDEPYLVAYALGNSIDYIVYGRVEPAENGFSCDISVFDRSKGKTVIEKRAGPVPALELFEALDELGAGALEAMTGSHIGFGRLELANQGEAGSYRVSIDGMNSGEGVGEVPRALAGRRLVRITQRRMLGDCEVAKGEVEVPEGGEARFEFAIPYCTEAERQRLDGAKAAVETALSSAYDDQATTASIQAYADLLADVAYSPRLADERAPIESWKARALLAKCRSEIEASAWSPRVESLDPIISLYARADSLPDVQEIKAACEEDALLLACLLELEAGNRIATMDYTAALGFYRSIFGFSRLLPEDSFPYYIEVARILGEAAQLQPDQGSAERASQAFRLLIEASERFASFAGYAHQADSIVLIPTDWGARLDIDGAEHDPGPVLASRNPSSVKATRADGSSSPISMVSPNAFSTFTLIRSGFARITLPSIPASASAESAVQPEALPITGPGPKPTANPGPSADVATMKLPSIPSWSFSVGIDVAQGFFVETDDYGSDIAIGLLKGNWSLDFAFYPFKNTPTLGIDINLSFGSNYDDYLGYTISPGLRWSSPWDRILAYHAGVAPEFGYYYLYNQLGSASSSYDDLLGFNALVYTGFDFRPGRLLISIDSTITYYVFEVPLRLNSFVFSNYLYVGFKVRIGFAGKPR